MKDRENANDFENGTMREAGNTEEAGIIEMAVHITATSREEGTISGDVQG
eukprot:CAMPEP_0185281574 /NCGR_PEP_ID=MMETSP1359-20130426/66795_1 /TAXON_ID=552665 /ORGANISM="Bigelowiella longifila, Strain CCMP242" /LENGTH=49 /DNA_ID=CAMNT_0027877023 /DNA_START=38 /DNA_END=187 /DNA_ORIENTATION=+